MLPYHVPFSRPAGDPEPLHYLDSEHNRRAGSLDIQLDACLQTLKMREAGQGEVPICRTNYRHAYWTVAQMVAHHTVNGRNLQPGDLFGSGTLSGPTLDQAAALVELTVGRKQPLQLPNGEMRTYFQDGDAVVLRGWCEKPGATRIGFGECWGTVLPAKHEIVTALLLKSSHLRKPTVAPWVAAIGLNTAAYRTHAMRRGWQH